MSEHQPLAPAGTPAEPRSAVGDEPVAGTSTPPSSPAPASVSTQPSADPLRGSRTSGIWAGTVVAAVLLVLLIVFIVQNTQKVEVAYFGWEGTAPLSVALLVAATAGLLLAILAASLRILQLRRRVRRERR